MTQKEHEAAVLTAHARYASALNAMDEHLARGVEIARELEGAEAELRVLARRQVK